MPATPGADDTHSGSRSADTLRKDAPHLIATERYALRDGTTHTVVIHNLTHNQATQLADELKTKGHRLDVVIDNGRSAA